MQILINNFDALINNRHIHNIFKDLPHNEIVEFAVELKNFYDRMISIAQKEGYKIQMPPLLSSGLQDLKVYLYYMDFDKAGIWL